MSHEHGTYGWERYKTSVELLKKIGVNYTEELKDESFVRGWDGSCFCSCQFAVYSDEYAFAEKHSNLNSEDFEKVLSDSFKEEEQREDSRDYHKQLREKGKITCPCCEGTCDHNQRLRIARFQVNGKNFVIEEYLAVDDQDCDGSSQISVSIYEQGQRPELVTEVLEHR